MTIQTERIQQFLHGYTKQLKIKDDLQKQEKYGTVNEDKVTLSIEAKRMNVRDKMASKVYQKITEQKNF